MADKPIRYNGKGFSLRGEKNRLALPASLRKDVVASSAGERVLCLAKHHAWTCLIGFGRSRIDSFDDYLDREEERATRLGTEVVERPQREVRFELHPRPMRLGPAPDQIVEAVRLAPVNRDRPHQAERRRSGPPLRCGGDGEQRGQGRERGLNRPGAHR